MLRLGNARVLGQVLNTNKVFGKVPFSTRIWNRNCVPVNIKGKVLEEPG